MFKLERERPCFDVFNHICYYLSRKTIRAYNFTNTNDIALVNIKRGHPGQSPAPRSLSYNPAEHSVMISYVFLLLISRAMLMFLVTLKFMDFLEPQLVKRWMLNQKEGLGIVDYMLQEIDLLLLKKTWYI